MNTITAYKDYQYKYTCSTYDKNDELRIHKALDMYRLRKDREFFNVELNIIIKTIQTIIIEQEFLTFIKHYYTCNFQYKPEWCTNTVYSFYLEEYGIIIELDNNQHETRQRDLYKMERALANNLTVIRVLQTEFWDDVPTLKNEILSTLQKLIKTPHAPEIYTICKNQEFYDSMFC
jgi:very-short-patch-repair endonuclease